MNILFDYQKNPLGFSWQCCLFFTSLNMMERLSATSVNQPSLGEDASWNPIGITFVDHKRIGTEPCNIFIDQNNKIYIATQHKNKILIQREGQTNLENIIFNSLELPKSIFATSDGFIYVGNYDKKKNPSVRKYLSNGLPTGNTWKLEDVCRSIFVDLNNAIYCSLEHKHIVQWKKHQSVLPERFPVAGFWKKGSQGRLLNRPRGIFVASNFALYVADCGNNRIRMFPKEFLNGITVAGDGASGTISLHSPTDVALDGNGYLFIVDQGNNRIVREGPKGFRCIIGCSQKSNSNAYLLKEPETLSFDKYGNIYVLDRGNNRIQKFLLKKLSNTNHTISDISYNQPVLCPTASWNPQGVTLINQSLLGERPWDIFVDRNNTLYVNAKSQHQIQTWYHGNMSGPMLSNALVNSLSVFVADNGDIYVSGNDSTFPHIEKWPNDGTNRSTVMYVSGNCFDLFVDIYENIYCSLSHRHHIIRRLFNESANTTKVIAGHEDGTNGSTAAALKTPRSIFVTVDLKMYVADCGNDRVQRFDEDQPAGVTVVDTKTIDLDCPTGLAFDSSGYLFVSDSKNNRIIGSGPNGFRCIVGCNRINGSAADQLSDPRAIAFDNYGNIYVADGFNNRIQKFEINHLCESETNISYNLPQLHRCTQWNFNGTTLLDNDTIGQGSWGLFVNTNDVLYVSARSFDHIILWQLGDNKQLRNVTVSSTLSASIFVTYNGDIFFDSINEKESTIYQWKAKNSTENQILNVSGSCYGLFVDLLDNLYCSIRNQHKIIQKSLLSPSDHMKLIAGNGTAGSTSSLLNTPLGIFVTTDFRLYVADCKNNRIQLFFPGEIDGITIIGNDSTSPTIDLSCPTSVILDADGFLFISDSGHHRIVGAGQDGYRCVIGCTNERGVGTDHLNNPTSIAFSSQGNLYVVDYNNSRIQQFLLTNETCASHPGLDAFISFTCFGTPFVGADCNISSTACDVLELACLNGGECVDTDDQLEGFYCQCPEGFHGTRCEIANDPCFSEPCHNDGTCTPTSHRTFQCQCSRNWTGHLCHIKVNFCHQITCFNNGQCRPLIGDYRCECLSDRYSGRHCEKVSGSIILRQKVAKSFAYVAVIAIGTVAAFIIVLDVLKYGFGIDPVGSETEEKKKKNASKKRPRQKQKF